jgi:lipoate-protein ligase A
MSPFIMRTVSPVSAPYTLMSSIVSKPARLLVHPEMNGAKNMAIDQAILESTAENGQTTLRFYRWTPATLSLGYFQRADDRSLHAASSDCPMVRRASGGGAIVHDDELTYSICVATKGKLAKANAELYDTVHHAILKSLAEQGVEVQLYESPNKVVKASTSDPFLCFERRAVGDIVCQGHKVGGSAQRRLKNALIQHGSLLLSQSRFAPELPGLRELSDVVVNEADLVRHVTEMLAVSLSVEFSTGNLDEAEKSRSSEIVDEKFGSLSWLNKR